MINEGVDPKALCFLQDSFATTINLLKSCLLEEIFNDLVIIEGMFPPNIKLFNPKVASWITAHVQAATTDESTKIKLLLNFYFAH